MGAANQPSLSSPTDFNDLHRLGGLDAVRKRFLEVIEHAPSPLNSIGPAATITGSGDARSDSAGDVRWQASLVRAKDGTVSACISNLVKVLELHDQCREVIALNEFANSIEKRSAPPWFDTGRVALGDADYSNFRVWYCNQFGATPKTGDVAEAFLVVAEKNRFHPVRNYLKGLVWDGVPRISRWMGEYLGADCETDSYEDRVRYGKYLSLVGWKWLVMAVARVMQPPVKADNVLILEGPQGVGKSEALRILGGEWFSDSTFPLGDKDGYLQMQGRWIIELAELDAFNKVESTRAKAFFTSVTDTFRPPYARCTQSFARQCVFTGTTNQEHYLKDPTGNRRYWPVFCTAIDHEMLKRDRDQLWAEAYRRWKDGAKWWIEPEDLVLFEEQQESRHDCDVWEDLIVSWLRDATNHRDHYTTADIMSGALRLEPVAMKRPEQTRVGMVMNRLGWKKRQVSVTKNNGKTVREWVYVRPASFK